MVSDAWGQVRSIYLDGIVFGDVFFYYLLVNALYGPKILIESIGAFNNYKPGVCYAIW